MPGGLELCHLPEGVEQHGRRMNESAAARGAGPWRIRLERALANEADMAFKRRARAVFDFLSLADGDRVLDAGCGRGFFLNLTRALFPGVQLVGVELERPLLRIARRCLPSVEVAVARVERLPFATASFDKVIFSEVLEHIIDDEAALREIVRVMAPGGVLALTVPNADYPFWWDPINKSLERLVGRHIQHGPLAGIWANHVRLYSPERLTALVADCGLVVDEVRFLVHYCFPFSHNLVYGLGKPLLERGLLPDALATAADRFDLEPAPRSLWNPVGLGLRAFNAMDRLNDRSAGAADRSSVIIALRAHKPGGPHHEQP